MAASFTGVEAHADVTGALEAGGHCHQISAQQACGSGGWAATWRSRMGWRALHVGGGRDESGVWRAVQQGCKRGAWDPHPCIPRLQQLL
eukprot:9724934-Prorocentrum_lima.AAC.1